MNSLSESNNQVCFLLTQQSHVSCGKKKCNNIKFTENQSNMNKTMTKTVISTNAFKNSCPRNGVNMLLFFPEFLLFFRLPMIQFYILYNFELILFFVLFRSAMEYFIFCYQRRVFSMCFHINSFKLVFFCHETYWIQ